MMQVGLFLYVCFVFNLLTESDSANNYFIRTIFVPIIYFLPTYIFAFEMYSEFTENLHILDNWGPIGTIGIYFHRKDILNEI